MSSDEKTDRATELLSPAGDFTTALSAFAAGADAVYCGLSEFSARAFAPNLSYEELANLIAYARAHGKKVYVTFNTLLDEDQLEGAVEALARLEELGPDGVIVQDLGIAQLVRRHFPKLELHASTQLVAHNLEGVLALKELGFRRVVLARELSLAEITTIAQRCGARKVAADGRPELELEVFIHGALCYSISGLCLYGALEKGRSGNRGTCPYCCRQEGKRKKEEGRSEAGRCYPFSMKDLRLGADARKLVEAGVTSLKIEGRMKSPLYVASVTRYYRDLLDGTPARVTPGDLETVFSRRTTELYFNGRGAVEKAFAKLGGTGYRLGHLTVEDPEKLFAPPHALNDLRRDLVEKLDELRDRLRRAKIDAALADEDAPTAADARPCAVRRVKIRPGQKLPPGDWAEIVVAINADTADDVPARETSTDADGRPPVRLALPVYTPEPDFNRLRTAVKRLLRAGYAKWECADLATLRLLTALGVTDITADGTLAAFNSRALSALTARGVTRFVASPENSRENLQYLAESGYAVEFLVQQSTPLFLSLTEPAPYASETLCTFRRDGLWVTTKRVPRTFAAPSGVATRLDLSWDPDHVD